MADNSNDTGGIHIQIGGNVQQFINKVENGATVTNNFYEGKNSTTDYFDSEKFKEAIAKVTDYISKKKATWAMVYYFLRRHGLEEMTKAMFGNFIHDHGGPSARTVYSSGDYDMSSAKLMKERYNINALEAFFPEIM